MHLEVKLLCDYFEPVSPGGETVLWAEKEQPHGCRGLAILSELPDSSGGHVIPIFQLKNLNLKEVEYIAKVRDQPGTRTQGLCPRCTMKCRASCPRRPSVRTGWTSSLWSGACPFHRRDTTSHCTARATDSDSVGPGPANLSRLQVFACGPGLRV